VLTAELVILTLKIAVIAVTGLLAASLTALWFGRYRLHGRINLAFFILVLGALLGLELVTQVASPGLLQDYLRRQGAENALNVHLCFSVPAALVLPAMLWTGLKGRRQIHITMGVVFLMLWAGTFVTGIFFLPHSAQP
jgi:hypothetical protein